MTGSAEKSSPGLTVAIFSTQTLLADSLVLLLRQHGLSAVTATAQKDSSVSEIATAIRQTRAAVAVLVAGDDPVPTLLQVTRELRNEPQIRSVILASPGNHALLIPFLSAGSYGYLLKTAGEADLVAAIRAAASGHRFIDPDLSEFVAQAVLTPETQSDITDLKGRELAVLRLIALGHTQREIAALLNTNVKAVEGLRRRLSEKLKLRRRSELVAYAVAIGLVSQADIPSLPDNPKSPGRE